MFPFRFIKTSMVLVSFKQLDALGWILGKCAVGRCSLGASWAFRTLGYSKPSLEGPLAVLVCFAPKIWRWHPIVSGLSRGGWCSYTSCEEKNTWMYPYLIRLLKRLHVFFFGWFQTCLKCSSFILMFDRWVETITYSIMFRLVVFAARTIVWVGCVRVSNQPNPGNGFLFPMGWTSGVFWHPH